MMVLAALVAVGLVAADLMDLSSRRAERRRGAGLR